MIKWVSNVTKKKSRIRKEHLIGNLWMAPIEGKKKKSKNAV